MLRNVGECTVAIVAVKRITQRLRRIIEVGFSAVDQVDVHPAIVVKIEEGASGSAGFG
jgi:hypothetical protein